jgi:hypothetical protein
MAVHYSCAPDDGRMWRPKHVELETFKEKRILFIQLDLNKTSVTKSRWATAKRNRSTRENGQRDLPKFTSQAIIIV